MSESDRVYNGPANNFDELCEAFRLVQQRYEVAGYAKSNLSGMRFGIHNFLKSTTSFVGTFADRVVATTSLVVDSGLGLPLSRSYEEEYNFLKSRFGKIAEGTMFACEAEFENKGMGVQLGLFHHMLCKCVTEGVEALSLVVNPKHMGFYQKVLGFECISTEKTCLHVQNAPGVMIFKKTVLDVKDKTLFGKYISEINDQKFSFKQDYFLSSEDTKLLLRLEPSVYISFSAKEKGYIASSYNLLSSAVLSPIQHCSGPKA